jgi:hypothetical protein
MVGVQFFISFFFFVLESLENAAAANLMILVQETGQKFGLFWAVTTWT